MKITNSTSTKTVYCVRWISSTNKTKNANFTYRRLAELFYKEKAEEGYEPTLWEQKTVVKTNRLEVA